MDNSNRFEGSNQPREEMDQAFQIAAETDRKSDAAGASHQGRTIFFIVLGIILVLGLIIAGVYFLAQPSTPTDKIRDIFIIFMALESLLIGFAMVILLVQLARLINLLQNEIKPILDSTQDTVGHLRGTTVFLSENLVEPVIKLNEYLAGFSQLFQVIGLAKKGKSPKKSKGE